MKYNKDVAMEYILRKLLNHTFTMNAGGDPIFIHALFGEEVGGFFFLLENLRSKAFFTCLPEKIISIVELPGDSTTPNIDTE